MYLLKDSTSKLKHPECVYERRPRRTHGPRGNRSVAWRITSHQHWGQGEQGSSMQQWTQWAAGSALPLRGRPGSAGWGWWGKSWHLMDRLCVFSSERPLHPTRGISSSSPAIVLRIFADHPAAPETFKGRKEKSSCCWPTGYICSRGVNMLLWTGLCQQQDVWQSQRHISGTETARTFLWILSFHYCRKVSWGRGAESEGPTCVRVDKPQGSSQQSPYHKGCKGDSHHCRSVQHVHRFWGGKRKQHPVHTCWHQFSGAQTFSLLHT